MPDEVKRARDLQIGDMFADGSHVVSINKTDTMIYIRTRVSDEPLKRRRYQPNTILPSSDNPYPSQYEDGHPWARYRVRNY